MLITLFTDASYNQKLRRGTWAAYFIPAGTMSNDAQRASGIMRQTLDHASDAEISALANGIWTLTQRLHPPAGSRIIAQTDCLEILNSMSNNNHPRQNFLSIMFHIRKLQRDYGLVLDLWHVKGHQGTKNPRSAVNSWCDAECKRQMGYLLETQATTQKQDKTKA